MKTYEQVKEFLEKKLPSVSWDHQKLNEFHEIIMKEIIQIALTKVESELGKPPTHFAFFVMGSAARHEQSVWSDQDHGIIYDGPDHFHSYFIRMGKEITRGFALAGYEPCDGNVMASNPYWCKSSADWTTQIAQWFDEADWESLRYFSTFFDSRVLAGEDKLLLALKTFAFSKLDENPVLYKRLYENVGFVKKGIGIFGQILSEEKGEEAGTINLKQTIFFPYVNSLRLLALIEKIPEASTLERFQKLPEGYETIKVYQSYFLKLLNYRLYFQKDAVSYKKVHLLPVNAMSAREKDGLKEIMKKGRQLFKETKEIIDRRCSP
ncbi:hypothetical protein DS745_02095 [Anaerobacillus alkaliphilus]|uniref:CBS domain-containing protein n=1 Tax=Anaerobacillus alkaliphilus TaxID=1548597 RepID=A0A4Q0VXL1_9BACI|nr:DUF294 nucleotidyltransferase-like domain-containing protein [Anaerobacillus alkaliphilus]RXJ04200.1 hypothetical protein DS745_02095 [Anaerobacillus alkaliphilus]